MKSLLISLIYLCFSFSINAQHIDKIFNKKDFINIEEELYINFPPTKNTNNYKTLADSIYRNTTVNVDVIFSKKIFDYDFYGNEIEYVTIIDNCGTLELHDKKVSSYDEYQNRIQSILYNWDLLNEKWENNRKFEYFYDSNNIMTQYLWSYWNWYTEQWELDRNTFMYYDSNNHKIQEEIFLFNTNSQQWENAYKRDFTNDIEGNIQEILVYSWDNNSQNWVYKWKYDYIYLPDGKLEKIIMLDWNFSTQQWDNLNIQEYFYNNIDQLIEKTNSGLSRKRYQYSYYSYGKLKVELISEWDYNINNWGPPYDRLVWYYSIHEVADISEENKISYRVYPNPAINFITIKTEENIESKIVFFNIQGKQLKIHHINSQSQIDVSGFSEGIYFYKIQTKKATQTGKFIIKR